jgi:hypothetical protein
VSGQYVQTLNDKKNRRHTTPAYRGMAEVAERVKAFIVSLGLFAS